MNRLKTSHNGWQMRSKLIFAASLTLLSVPAGAQRAEEVAARNDCRLATQVVTTGRPATKAGWAASTIAECGAEAGVSIAAGIRANRTSRDFATHARLGNVAVVLRDAAMFEAALDVLADAGATSEARVFAARILTLGLQPHLYMTYEQIAEGNCYGEIRGPHATKARGGAPIRTELAALARASALRVHADSTAPREVRMAARCASIHELAPFSENLDEPEEIIVVQDLSVVYLCGNRFRVRNPYTVDMKIQYGVERARDLTSIIIPSNSDRVFESGREGTFRILDEDGEFIAEAKNEGRTCTP